MFVCAVDHGVTEEKPIDGQYHEQVCEDQYCEQVCEDQYRDPNPKDSTSIRTTRKVSKTASSISSFDAYFVPVL